MQYASKELIAHVNAQIAQDDADYRQTLECLKVKKEQYVRELVRKVAADNGITLDATVFEQVFQECLAWTNAHPRGRVSIVVNEMQL